jgi:hypothetical protein
MKIDYKEVIDSRMDGEYVWICDYRYNDIHKKAIRNIKPQKVLVRSNRETNKRIYYSESHFLGLNKKSLPLKSKIIPVFDNTGYRSFTGVPVKIFDNEDECRRCYKAQAGEIIVRLAQSIKLIEARMEEVKNTLENI